MLKIYNIFFIVSLVLMAASLGLFLTYGLNLGVDFTGGSLLEVRSQNVDVNLIESSLEKIGFNNAVISQTENSFLIRIPEISEAEHQEILNELGGLGQLEEKRFDSIGSVLGSELKRKSITAIIIALILISLYLAIAFYKVGGTISPWILALGAIVALIHDLLLPLGVFVWLGKFKGIAIDASLIAAALTILGYSVNDTVVIYDRVRENILKSRGEKFNDIVHKSVKQTLSRSINTGLSAILVMIAIYIFGGPTLKSFSLALIIGIASGAYSSIFVASPILMMLHKK